MSPALCIPRLHFLCLEMATKRLVCLSGVRLGGGNGKRGVLSALGKGMEVRSNSTDGLLAKANEGTLFDTAVLLVAKLALKHSHPLLLGTVTCFC